MVRTITLDELREDIARLRALGAQIEGSPSQGMIHAAFKGRSALRGIQLPGGLWLIRFLDTAEVEWKEDS